MDWPQLRALIRVGDVAAVTTAVSELSAVERRALAPGITALERSLRRWEWPSENGEPEEWPAVGANERTEPALAVAAAGVLPAAKLGPLLGRVTLGWIAQPERHDWSDLRHWPDPYERGHRSVVDQVMAVLTTRGLVGEPGIVAQVARRVRADESWEPRFDLAYRLAVAAPGEPPTDDGFLLAWMSRHSVEFTAELRERATWATLVPRFLAIRGGGQHLDLHPELQEAFVELAAAGLLDSDVLLDACLAALQVIRRRTDLLGLVALHRALAPSDAAVSARVGDYVALAAGGASFVAKAAQERLRDLDGAGLLDTDLMVEVSRAVLLRPEKGLVRTQLAWLRVALQSQCPDAERERLLRCVAAGFGQPDAALQARALDLLTPHAAGLSATTRLDLAREAVSLALDLRPRAAGLFGTAEIVGEPGTAAVPAQWTVGPSHPPAARRPVGSAAELAECLARYNQGTRGSELADHDLIERLLDGLVRCSWSDREGLREALAPVIARTPYLRPGPPSYPVGETLGIYDVISAAVAAAAGAHEGAAPPGPVTDPPPLGVSPEAEIEAPPYCHEPDVVLFHRFAEVAAGIWWAPVPMLLAAPTTEDGTLEADELARRLATFEVAGCRPWPHDLVQALLRVAPADLLKVHDAVCRVAGSAGASLLAWLAGPNTGNITQLPPDLVATWARLWTFTEPERTYGYTQEWSAHWAWLLPFSRETVATHLVHRIRDSRRGDGPLLVQFSTAHGTLGPASYRVLAHGLNFPEAGDRAGATDALLTLTGRGELDSTALGEVIGSLVADRALMLNRVVPALRDFGAAGAWPSLWELLAAALTHCLVGVGERPAPQLAELLALAVEAAHATGASGSAPPGLDAVAARPGRTRLRTEARRLQAALTPQT